MTLTHLFKAQAIFAWIWVVLIWAAPEMAMEVSFWVLTPNLESMAQFLSVPMFGIGVISWMMPSWAGDNLKQVGMVMGVYLNIVFIAIGLFHASTGAANYDPMGMIPVVIFTALFFWKSRASD